MFSNDIRRTIRGIIREYGPGACEPPARMRGFLNDLCPERKAEIHLLIAALMVCPLAYFQAVKKGQAERLLVLKIDALRYDLSITAEAAHWAVESWALALGVVEKPLPRPVEPPPPAAPLPPVTVRLPAFIPLTPSLPETGPVAPAVPANISQGALKPDTFDWEKTFPKGVRSPAAFIAGGVVVVGLLFDLVAALSGRPGPPPVPIAAPVTAYAAPSPPDPALGREQALAQQIQGIRSGLEPGTSVVWPLGGKANGMKILLPPKRAGTRDLLMGNADLHRGCEVVKGELEQALQSAGYPEEDIAGCSVFVCTSTGTQLSFSSGGN